MNVFDHRFGVKHDFELVICTIGESNIFYSTEMITKNVSCIGTPELYELLLKTVPIGYNSKKEVYGYYETDKCSI